MPTTWNTSDDVMTDSAETLARWLDESPKVLVGAGAGLSVAAGIDLHRRGRLRQAFPRAGPSRAASPLSVDWL